MALLGAFNAAWPVHLAGNQVPLTLAVIAVSGVVLGALYMLWLAQRILFGEARAPHAPLTDLNARETTILVAIVAAIFAIGLFPGQPLAKTELAARDFQQRVLGETVRLGSVTP
jgi:NADH-quinone oxidoreductase subunit M